jgi:hypothetical protein
VDAHLAKPVNLEDLTARLVAAERTLAARQAVSDDGSVPSTVHRTRFVATGGYGAPSLTTSNVGVCGVTASAVCEPSYVLVHASAISTSPTSAAASSRTCHRAVRPVSPRRLVRDRCHLAAGARHARPAAGRRTDSHRDEKAESRSPAHPAQPVEDASSRTT